jgi:hypothetical protein
MENAVTEEDPFYNTQTVEDEVMLNCLDLNAKGITNDEIAYGLYHVIGYFAEAIEDCDHREGMALLLEGLVDDLRNKQPYQKDLELTRNLAVYRLNHQAEQEGRAS